MKTKGIVQPLVLAAVLALGFTTVWALVGTWAVSVCEYTARSGVNVEHLIFLPDGTALVRVAEAVRHGAESYRDLEGNPVPRPAADNAHWLKSKTLPAALPERAGAGDVTWADRIHTFADGRSPAGYWYFISDGRPGGAGYFVCYDSKSNACLGHLGTAGFRAGPLPPDERIPFGGATSGPQSRVLCTEQQRGPTDHPDENAAGQAPRGSLSTWDVYVLGPGGKVYHADLQKRTLEVILDEPGLRSAAVVQGVLDTERGTPHYLAVRTDDAVLVLDERGSPLKRWPVPETMRDRDFNYAESRAGEAVLIWSGPFDPLVPQVEHRVAWVATDGRCREAGVSLPYPGARSLPVLEGVVFPSPLALGGYLASQRTGELLHAGLAATYPEALARALTEFRAALALALLVGCGLAVLCHRRQMRFGAGRTERVLWPLFVLALGLPGWVGYRFGRSWPVLEACPGCEARVPRDRAGCARCEAEFPPPPLKGTEVFA
ncbi:MAG TPA: hypothetical protein VFE78_10770 [Gemmataceae bacterium]|nr:hypothetical protein [Gemmataceae bacterium]